MSDIGEQKVSPGTIKLWWIGQSGFILKTSRNKLIVVDAYLSNSAAKGRPGLERRILVPIQPEELVCDFYLCTHNHADHADKDTVENLRNKDKMTFIGPRNVIKSIKEWGVPEGNMRLLEAGDSLEIEGIKFTGTFCIPNTDKVLDSIGFLIETEGKCIYISGDTGYHPFMHYLQNYVINAAIVCINGKFGNMNVNEAYSLACALNPRWVIPCHFDMFPINTEDPESFRKLFAGHETVQCIVPEIGNQIEV
jgi:L-ascorbate 6-phosphate lactonase